MTNLTNTIAQFRIAVDGKIAGYDIKANEFFSIYNDMESYTTIEEIKTKFNKLYKKMDTIGSVTISIYNGDSFSTDMVKGIRFSNYGYDGIEFERREYGHVSNTFDVVDKAKKRDIIKELGNMWELHLKNGIKQMLDK